MINTLDRDLRINLQSYLIQVAAGSATGTSTGGSFTLTKDVTLYAVSLRCHMYDSVTGLASANWSCQLQGVIPMLGMFDTEFSSGMTQPTEFILTVGPNFPEAWTFMRVIMNGSVGSVTVNTTIRATSVFANITNYRTEVIYYYKNGLGDPVFRSRERLGVR